MKKTFRLLVLLLALMMTVPIAVSCTNPDGGINPPDSTESTSFGTTEEPTETTQAPETVKKPETTKAPETTQTVPTVEEGVLSIRGMVIGLVVFFVISAVVVKIIVIKLQ